MHGVPPAVFKVVEDALFGPAGAPTLMAVLTATSFLLSAQIQQWNERRNVAVALRMAGLLTLLGTVVVNMHRPGWLQAVDRVTASWMAGHRSENLNLVASTVGDVSSPGVVALGALTAAMLLSWRARSVLPGLVVLATVALAGLVTVALRTVLTRPHPPPALQMTAEPGGWLPPGHVAVGVALVGIVAVCGLTRGRRSARLGVTVAVCAAVVGMVVAPVYLGQRWLSDDIAGALLGAAVVYLGAVVWIAALPSRSTLRRVLSYRGPRKRLP